MAATALSNEEFILRSHAIHGNKYTYEKSRYISSKKLVTITCPTHGDFIQLGNKHLLGSGCPECGKESQRQKMTGPKKDTESFVKELRSIYGRKYDYSEVEYKGLRSLVSLTCKKHGKFEQRPGALLGGHGCQKCGYGVPTVKEFVQQSRQIHGRQYDYSKVEFDKLSDRVILTCKPHGEFIVSVREHLRGYGCKQCGLKRHAEYRLTKAAQEFVVKAQAVHGDRYDYSQSVYAGRHRLVKIGCKIHGVFEMQAGNHLNGQNCPSCAASGYSDIAIRWIEWETGRRRWKSVWHALNGGEFLIPGTRYSADGYHQRSNTIFEFYGDAFHGNLSRFKPTDRPNPYSDLTTRQLYDRTMRREQELKALGYNLVTIWETEFNEIEKSKFYQRSKKCPSPS